MLSNFFTTLVPLLLLTASSNPPVLDQHTFVSGNIAQPMTNTTQLPEEDALFYYNPWGNASIKITGVEENQIEALHPEMVSLVDSLIYEHYGVLSKEERGYTEYFSNVEKLIDDCENPFGKGPVSQEEVHEFLTCIQNIDPSAFKKEFKKAAIDSQHSNDVDYDAINADLRKKINWIFPRIELLSDQQLHAIYNAITSNLEEMYSTIMIDTIRRFFVEHLDAIAKELADLANFSAGVAEALSIKEDDYHLQVANDGGIYIAGATTSYGNRGDAFFIPIDQPKKMTVATCSDVNCTSVESTTLE